MNRPKMLVKILWWGLLLVGAGVLIWTQGCMYDPKNMNDPDMVLWTRAPQGGTLVLKDGTRVPCDRRIEQQKPWPSDYLCTHGNRWHWVEKRSVATMEVNP